MTPVTRWSPYAAAASRKWGIPAATLLGLIQVESGGNINAVSPTGAFGLTQFEPATASQYGVTRTSPLSQIDGAAHYLHDLGYNADPQLALSKYNAGPGNPSAAGNYAANVLAAARSYGNASTPAGTPPSSQPATTTPAPSSSGNALQAHSSGALKALVEVTLILGGALLIGLGLHRAAGAGASP